MLPFIASGIVTPGFALKRTNQSRQICECLSLVLREIREIAVSADVLIFG